MQNKFHFTLRANANKKGLHQLFIDARIAATRVRTPINIHVPKNAFSRTSQKCQAVPGFSQKEASSANKVIAQHKEKCSNILQAAADRGQILTPDKWRTFLNSSNYTDFISYATRVIAEKENLGEIVPSTAKTYQQALNQLIGLLGPLITFSQMADVARNLEGHLKAKGLGKNTRKKTHTRIKTIILHAQKEGIAIENPYQNFKIGTIKGNRVALSEAEFKTLFALYRAKTLPDHYQNVLQYFLFACLTGVRYSDVKELTTKNLQGPNLVFTPQKTKRLEKQIEMRLPAPALELITAKSGKLFNVITDQKTNLNLKAIARHVGIHKHVTYHCARHTFGTLFIVFGGDVSQLQELMGHSKIETTSNYLHMAESLKNQNLTVFDEI